MEGALDLSVLISAGNMARSSKSIRTVVTTGVGSRDWNPAACLVFFRILGSLVEICIVTWLARKGVYIDCKALSCSFVNTLHIVLILFFRVFYSRSFQKEKKTSPFCALLGAKSS